VPDRKFTLFTTRSQNRSITFRYTIIAGASALAFAALLATVTHSPASRPPTHPAVAADVAGAAHLPARIVAAGLVPAGHSARGPLPASHVALGRVGGAAAALTVTTAHQMVAGQMVPAASSSPRARRLARRIAWLMMWRFGWRARRQFPYLLRLWMRESSWNVYATNPYSGAYGIPQAVPGWKMASAGRNWRTSARTQIRWGLRYIRARYGSPRAAWAHECAYGWY